MKMVNLGCGNRFHKDWINLDYTSSSPLVQKYDLHKSLPFDNEEIDVVYCSHVLEHFSKSFAPKFLSECFRILKPKGTIRIVVPDLEQLMRNYLEFLEKAKHGDKDAEEKYEWTMIEIFDQMVRNHPGGEMLDYWKQTPMPQEEFVIERVGSEVKSILNTLRNKKPDENATKKKTCTLESIGEFRLSGEVHQWMYDSFSLSKLLQNAGFKKIQKMKANKSYLKNFNNYLLDIESNGDTRKPDSLFMEAVKP